MKRYDELTKRYILTNKKRSIITIITILLSMAIMISFTMIYNAQEEEERKNAKAEVGYYDVTFEGLSNEQYEQLKSDNRLKSVYRAKIEGAIIPNNINEVMRDSYDFTRLTKESYDNVFKFKLMQGRIPEKEDEIVIDYETAKIIGDNVKIGSEVSFNLYPNAERIRNLYRRGSLEGGTGVQSLIESMNLEKSIESHKEVVYKVVGISENMAGQYNVYGFVSDEELYENNNIDTFATLKSTKKTGWGEYGYGDEKAIADDLGLRFLMRSNLEGKGNIGSQVRYADYTKVNRDGKGVTTGNSSLIIIMVAVFMFATIFNIFNISVFERIRHLGMLRAVGATRKQISNVVLNEANIYALIGIPLGLIIGYILTKVLFIPVSSLMNVELSTSYLTITSGEIIRTILIVYIMVMFSANFGISKQIKMTPVEAMNTFISARNNEIDIVGSNKVIEGKGKIEIKLAYKNLYRNITRNNMCTLVISISMVLFIFFSSIFLNGLNNIDVSLPSSNWDMELNRGDTAESFNPLSIETKEKFKSVDGVEGVYRNSVVNIGMPIKTSQRGNLLSEYYNSEDRWLKVSREYGPYSLADVSIRVVDEDSIDLYNNYLIDGEVNNEKLNNNGILLVNSGSKRYIASIIEKNVTYQFSASDKMLDVSAGETINIPRMSYPTDGDFVREILNGNSINEQDLIPFNINGIVNEDALRDNFNKYNPKEMDADFKLIMTRECYEKNFGPIQNETVFVKTNNNVDRDKLKDEMVDIGNQELYKLKDYKESQQQEKIKVNENLAIQIMFLVSLIIIVIINVANTFYASIVMRKKELAAIRAIGMTPKQMKKMIYTEVFIIAIGACIWSAFIGGMPTLWKEFNLQKVGMSNMNLWAISMIVSIIAILLITFVSTIGSIRSLSGLSIVDDLREEE